MSDLEQLKALLFGAEKQALDSIAERVERRDVRTVDVADVLPEAIHQSHQKDSALVESLTQPVGECLQKAFREDPETYGNALYPVIGPAIRKAIVHALRTFTQQINQTVEHSVSTKGLAWRWQAFRAGVPFGEFLLQKTLSYRVEQAYLISRENGLLISHVHHQASKIKDSDAVSAMFTAIQDFVKESFSPDRSGRLESADMGEFTLWAIHGPHALLVCVIRGLPPNSLRTDLSAILERIHFRYGEAIRLYKGDTATVPDAEIELQRCLRFEEREETSSKSGRPPVAVIVILLLLLAVGVAWGVRNWRYSSELGTLETALAATPGLYITQVGRDGGRFSVRGLADPLAERVVDIAGSLGISADRLSVSVQPFQSLQPEIIVARAAEMLDPPESVNLSVAGATLTVTGDAPFRWRQQLQRRFTSLAGVRVLDASGLTSSDRQQFADRVAELDMRKFLFVAGTDFVAGVEDEFKSYAAQLAALSREAAEFGYSIAVRVMGSTDSAGNVASNAALSARRARRAADILASAGVVASATGESGGGGAGNEAQDISQRYVQVNLDVTPRADQM